MYALGFALLSATLLAAAPPAAATPLTGPVHIGDVFVFRTNPADGVPAAVDFMEQRYPPIIPPGSEMPFFLLAVDLETAPGTYPLTVMFDVDEALESVTHVEVRGREFPVERLDLPPKMVTPPPEVMDRIARERKAAAAVYARSAPAPLWGPPFARPVDGTPSGNFGRRRILNDIPKSPHSGEDYSAPRGAEVRATARGRVQMAADLYYSGLTVLLDHGGGLVSQYFHLDEITVGEGEVVQPRQVIGKVGSTGRVTGPHLHFGIRLFSRRADPSMLWGLFEE